MSREQKIQKVKEGTHVIKNDMKGDKRVLDVLNECDYKQPKEWKWSPETFYERYFGLIEGEFLPIWVHEINNRPHYLMSELFATTQKEVFTVENLQDIEDSLDGLTLELFANKLNQMAFEAYKK